MVKMAIDYNERTDQAEAECARRPPAYAASGGGQRIRLGALPALLNPAAAPRRRGRVAQPNGGPLGPDNRGDRAGDED